MDQLNLFVDKLNAFLPTVLGGGDDKLHQAIQHSAIPTGKAIRGLLVHASMKIAGFGINDILPFAVAIELFHTYSLIHDDLPCMDNADLRRGKASCHVAFNEATAVLAGDALQAKAFELLSMPNPVIQAKNQLLFIQYLAKSAGVTGMALGQAIDIAARASNFEELCQMHRLKTGALIKTATMAGGILSDDDDLSIKLSQFGDVLGLLFQISDDLLDDCDENITGKTSQQDNKNNRVTFITLLGREKSLQMIETLSNQATDILKTIPKSNDLLLILKMVTKRN